MSLANSPTPRRIKVLQMLTLVLMLLPVAAVAYYVWHKHLGFQAKLADWEPRHARLQGLVAQQTEFESHTQLAQKLVAAYAHPAASEPTQTLNDVQQRIRTELEQAGLRVESINAIPAVEEGAFMRMRIRVRIDGNINQLQQALLQVRQQTPLLMVDGLRITNEGPMTKAAVQRLTGQIEFSVLKARP